MIKLSEIEKYYNGEIHVDFEEVSKGKVITELLKRIANLEYEVEMKDSIIENLNNYIDKMSYASVVDNPKEDLVKILKKEKQDD